MPFDDGLAVLKCDGQPDVSGIAGMPGAPDVGHEDQLVAYRQDIGTLATEGFLGIGTDTRIGMLRPWSPDARGGEHAGFVRSPASTTAGDHPIGAVLLEDGWCFVLSA